MKKAMCLVLACILICTTSVGCRGKRNPDGLSDKEAYDLALERLTDELKAEFADMFRYVVNKYPGYRFFDYSPGDDRPLADLSLTNSIYINIHSFDEEELTYISSLMDKLGARSFGIDINPNSGGTQSAFIFFAEGEYEYEQANLWYYFDGDQGRAAASDLGDGWYYSYWIRQ